ncbi:MAG: hypothetical protein WBQ21_09095, partial [Solirubrobacteraceae bacterium]
EIGSTLTATYPKPGKPVFKAANILDDLRRRDFTANAMALSLNEGSYALLMDPLNGVADIENRELRLVSNYGFIEDPVRMIRAVRLMARLGWQMDERTQTRYETGKQEGYISAMSSFQRGYETEEIFHEEDPLRVLKRLESEGWMKHLFPSLTSAKANTPELEKLRDVQGQLQVQGIYPEISTANFPLVTAKMPPKDVTALKKTFPRKEFVAEMDVLEKEGKEFAARLSGKEGATPSQAWKLLYAAKPEAVLWVAHHSKQAGIQAKFKGFFTEWAHAKLKLPHALMQEMRIVPDLPVYDELLDKLFFELMDGKLATVEEMKAYLEPYSPPAPPPPVHLRRARAAKKEAKPPKSRKKAVVVAEGEAVAGTGEPAAAAAQAKPAKPTKTVGVKAAAVKEAPAKVAKPVAPVKVAAVKVAAKKSPAPAKKVAAKAAAKTPAKKAAAKPAAKKVVAKKTAPKVAVKKVPVKKAAAKKPVAKVVAKRTPAKVPAKKSVAKAPAKKAAPAKKSAPKKPVAKKASKPAKKR